MVPGIFGQLYRFIDFRLVFPARYANCKPGQIIFNVVGLVPSAPVRPKISLL